MSDKMTPIPFAKLIQWIFEEYKKTHSVFGIPENKFYYNSGDRHIRVFGEVLDTPLGPAAGPHTQLAQNIIAAYLSGSRFFELKTVQIMDELEIPKPCIRAEDECYNTEWSTELSLRAAFNEYVKAWFALHVLQKEFFNVSGRRFLFNMSVGYDLQGIQEPKIDQFIEGLKDASSYAIFQECRSVLLNNTAYFTRADQAFVEQISPRICSSITLSTMHGCPTEEIEAILQYLIRDKKLHTFVKLNPTLLGYEEVRKILNELGYRYINLKEDSFTHDLQFEDAVALLKRLKAFALERHRDFGVKLSNTLPVQIGKSELPGEEMYMSGRALYPLTINLAYQLATALSGDLRISYSGGADYFNSEQILAAGIRPVTVCTTLLKPGGYQRFKQLAERLAPQLDNREPAKLDLAKLQALAESSLSDADYRKEKRDLFNRKTDRRLPVTDCFIAPCSAGCPIEQDIPEYLRLVGEKRYAEAFEVIVSKNPLPFITGTICYHYCMNKCTRLDYDESVHIRKQKLIAAEKGFVEFMAQVSVPQLKSAAQAAVIGAGPSGLSAAYFLAKAGLAVTVFDQCEKAGGAVQYRIPETKISREAIAKDVELIQKMGVRFRLGIDPNFSVQDYLAEGFSYIYLALGSLQANPRNLNLLQNNGIEIGDQGKIMFNEETMETNVANVYLGGDILRGPKSVVRAIAHGTKAAQAILAKEKLEIKQEYSFDVPFNPEKQFLEIAEKKGVLQAAGDDEQEPGRCLECNYLCDICAEVCPNRANIMIPVRGAGLKDSNQILHMDGMCNHCGNCATFCPYADEPFKVKLTLFWSENEFVESTNPGFFLMGDGSEAVFKLRLNSETVQVKFNEFGQTDVPLDNSSAAFIWTVFKQFPYLFWGK